MTRLGPLGLLLLAALAGCEEPPGPPPPEPIVLTTPPVHPPPPAPKADAEAPRLQVPIGGSADEAPPHLPFEIARVYEKQKPLPRWPWHVKGGQDTYFDGRLADGTEFTVGLHEANRLKGAMPTVVVDAQLSTATPAQGLALARAYAEAFGTRAPAPGKPKKVRPPLRPSAVHLGEDVVKEPGGGFGGKGGGWTAGKWTIERGGDAAEVFFNFNLKEKKGEWSQKRADDDPLVAKALVEVLHNGAAK